VERAALGAGDADDEKPGGGMDQHEQHGRLDHRAGPEDDRQRGKTGEPQHERAGEFVGIGQSGLAGGERGEFLHGVGGRQQRQQHQDERGEPLPGDVPEAHAGRAPIAFSVRRPARPTTLTRMMATTEPATSAAKMSMVWL
jgi:hypothetical protein